METFAGPLETELSQMHDKVCWTIDYIVTEISPVKSWSDKQSIKVVYSPFCQLSLVSRPTLVPCYVNQLTDQLGGPRSM